jgi:tyrosyl-tRNA synthetase
MSASGNAEDTAIDPSILEQAKELGRGAEVLPDGLNGLARLLAKTHAAGRVLRVKLGIDPTATDLHLGHAVVIRKLKQFQDFGHQVVLIIGGFTARIGDPSGRNTTRPPLSDAEVAANAKTYLDQMGMLLDLSKTEIVNNADWLAALDLKAMLKLASAVTVNQLLAKEAFGDRLEKQLPVSFHELFYPLLQGYDSVAIKADIELGGTDQRFNILQGRELQPCYGLNPQLAMLLPLLEGTDGVKKMSKSYDNYIALKDPADVMFGKCMRIPDDLIVKYFELATIFSGKEVDQIKLDLEHGRNPKDVKLKLAKQIVSQYCGADAGKHESEQWDRVHSQRQLPDQADIPVHKASADTPLFRILVDSGLASGTSEAKRLIKEGAVQYCSSVVTDPNFLPLSAQTKSDQEGQNVLQVGRRKFRALVCN